MNVWEISEKYASTSLVRAAVQLIPTFGGAIDTILSLPGAKLQQEKINDFMQRLDSDLNELKDKDLITKENFIERLSSDDAINILIRCIRETLNSLESEKLNIFKNIAKNYLSFDTLIDNTDIERFIRTTNNLTYAEFRYFIGICNGQNEEYIVSNYGTYLFPDKICARPMKIKFGFEEDIEDNWKIPQERIDSFARLESEGLLSGLHSGSEKMPIIGTNGFSEFCYQDKIIYNITEYGEKYKKWVS